MNLNRIWMGSKMPQAFKDYGQQWRDLNPGSKLHDWTEEEIFDTKWINQDVIDQMVKESKMPGADKIAFYTHVADVIDYEIIYGESGWYFNTDLKPIKPLSTLTYNKSFSAWANEDDVHAVNMAFYAPANDPLLAKIIELLPVRYFGAPGAFMNYSTGCLLIMQAMGYGYPTTRFHRNVFNPIHFTDFQYGDEPNLERAFPDETVAIHLWGHRSNQRGQRILESW